MMVSEEVTGDSSLIRAMSLLQRKQEQRGSRESSRWTQAFYSRLWFIYRMKKGFQLSWTMMSAVPMNAAPSSVSTRLCLPMATLYSLPELLGERRKPVMSPFTLTCC